ncbi:hypothetical protein Tco_1581334 [Tanacetum coccineum]
MVLQGITINTNAWSDAGHSVNHIYDILYMMGWDDVAVGVGGEGGILQDGTIQPHVGGYIPIIDQGSGTAGPCRYRQAIPVGAGGRLYQDTNFGYRKSFLPQGSRRYSPLRQPTAQQVLIEKISDGPVIPGDLSLGIGFPGDLSPGICRAEKLEGDTFPGDLPGRHRGAHTVSVKQIFATVEAFPG